jgi:hypothetical protein
MEPVNFVTIIFLPFPLQTLIFKLATGIIRQIPLQMNTKSKRNLLVSNSWHLNHRKPTAPLFTQSTSFEVLSRILAFFAKSI